ncbi:MAG: response regulator [Chloroflexi bacterium]|nr:response regulator [Chloroflexota bacterium]
MTPEGKRRALIVDPNACVRKLLAYTLRNSGYAVSLASRWTPSLERVQTRCVDVIVFDPVLLSWDQCLALCRRIRELAAAPVVLVTSRCVDEEVEQAMVAGAVAVIAKPFSPRDLVTRLDAILAQRGS